MCIWINLRVRLRGTAKGRDILWVEFIDHLFT